MIVGEYKPIPPAFPTAFTRSTLGMPIVDIVDTLNEIAAKAENMPGVKGVALVHRIGEVPLSSESVVIAVAAAHRREGWDAGEWILEEVKRQVEIWKLEVYEDDSSSWINGCERCK